jgi:hypothetical protein
MALVTMRAQFVFNLSFQQGEESLWQLLLLKNPGGIPRADETGPWNDS